MVTDKRAVSLAPAVQKSGRHAIVLTLAALTLLSGGQSQTTPTTVHRLLSQPVEPAAVTAFELQQYLSRRIPAMPRAVSSADWAAQQQTIRRHLLDDIAFHGWPKEWVDSPPKFTQVGSPDLRSGYRVTKFLYEIVPGVHATAILYEPEKTGGKVPGILNLLGHEPHGNAAEYEQKRAINFAKHGIVALSLGWVGFGELAIKGNDHDDAAALDLVGSNALGFFYLGMRRGLDYLASLPQVDPARLGVTGLSGGGWQTTVLSALDPRVAVSVEVAGFGSLEFNLSHPQDADEIEENATDLLRDIDYPTLIAMRAPRPTMLIHNAEDDCCFRADLVKPSNFDNVRPYFALFNKPDALSFYDSIDPGTHNYQLANRLQAYHFFSENFHLPVITAEIPSSTEVLSPEELAVGLPADNRTITDLARKLAASISRPAVPTDPAARLSWSNTQRATLGNVVRFTPVSVTHALRMTSTRRMSMLTLSYRFDFSNGLSASGVWLKADDAAEKAPATIVLNDQGYAEADEIVSRHVNRGEQVLALDLIFTGHSRPQTPDSTGWETLVATTGDRPLGLEVAQLLAVVHWLHMNDPDRSVEIETNGIRSGVIAAVAAALDPSAIHSITSRHAMKSLGHLLDAPVAFRSAADLFCLDLYKQFDIDSITAMAAPVVIQNDGLADHQ
jgi:dienelactone hydrolase